MLNQMSDNELRAEHKRCLQLEAICSGHGYGQASTVWLHTAAAIQRELDARARKRG